jgi:NADH-quinone oxidoreductase subunit E
MMTRSAGAWQGNEAADASAELGRMAMQMLQTSPLLSFNPLMANPAAVIAAATVLGFGFSTQMAGAFLGAFQGAVEVTNKLTMTPEDRDVSVSVSASQARSDAGQEAKPEKAERVAETGPQTLRKKPVFAKARGAAKAFLAKAEVAAPASAPEVLAPRRKPAAKAGDLKRIPGIGPKLEQVLKGLGVLSLADIAAWTTVDVARMDKELGFEGRIARDDWVGQAKLLAPKAAGQK